MAIIGSSCVKFVAWPDPPEEAAVEQDDSPNVAANPNAAIIAFFI